MIVFNKRTITKRHTLNFCEAVCLFAAMYVVYSLLRQHTVLPMSIDSVWYRFSHWATHFHVIAVALLPIYVAVMVFGTASIGIYLGRMLQRWIKR